MIRVVIGTQANQYIPQRVLEYSIRKHTSEEVDIRCLTQSAKRVGGTRFGFVRFCVPQTFGYEGRAVYLDADQLVLTDLRELVDSLDADRAIGLVRDLEGTFAGEPIETRNETSVMVLDCEKLKSWDPDQMFENVVPNGTRLKPGQIQYRDFMRLRWMDQSMIQAIDPRWNHYNIVRDDSKLVHFSHVREQPWKRPAHPLRDFWEGWLKQAMAEQFLTRGDLLRSALRLQLHPSFLARMLSESR